MRWQLRTILLATACTLSLLAAPGDAVAQGQLIEVSPTWGPPGTETTVTGSGWPLEYYPSVHLTITERRGGGFPSHLGDEFATPDEGGRFVKKIRIPSTATPGTIQISGIIGNGSGATADFTVATTQPPPSPRCAPTFIGLHGINEEPNDSKAVNDVWERLKEQAADEGLPLRPEPDHPQFPKLRIDEFFAYGATQVDARPVVNALRVPTAIDEGVDYLEEAAARAQAACAPARLVIVGYSQGGWIARAWLDDTTWSHDHIVAVMTLGDPQWDDGTNEGVARLTSAISPYRPAEPLGWRFGAVCMTGDAVCGRGYGRILGGRPERFAEIGAMTLKNDCRSHCPDVYIENGATAQIAQWLVELMRAQR